MSKSPKSIDPVPFYVGQMHGVMAFVRAVIRSHPDAESLFREFQVTSDEGLDRIHSTPIPGVVVQAYRQTCDQLLVALAKEIKQSEDEIIRLC